MLCVDYLQSFALRFLEESAVQSATHSIHDRWTPLFLNLRVLLISTLTSLSIDTVHTILANMKFKAAATVLAGNVLRLAAACAHPSFASVQDGHVGWMQDELDAKRGVDVGNSLCKHN